MNERMKCPLCFGELPAFGFTREDVAMLRDAVRYQASVGPYDDIMWDEHDRDTIVSLATRIEALLPAEEA